MTRMRFWSTACCLLAVVTVAGAAEIRDLRSLELEVEAVAPEGPDIVDLDSLFFATSGCPHQVCTPGGGGFMCGASSNTGCSLPVGDNTTCTSWNCNFPGGGIEPK